MMAGTLVTLPRDGIGVCRGCRRQFPIGGMVALDLPRSGWVLACWWCYQGNPCGSWRGSLIYWDGDSWRSVGATLDRLTGD